MTTEPMNVYARYGSKSKEFFYQDTVLRLPRDMQKQLSNLAFSKYHTSVNALIRGYIRDGLEAEKPDS